MLTQKADGAAEAQRFVVMRQAAPNLTDTNLAEATVKRDALYNEPRIAITFDEAGKLRLPNCTRDSIGQQVAIVLDGAVLMAPRVRESITGGECESPAGFRGRGPRAGCRARVPAALEADARGTDLVECHRRSETGPKRAV